MIVSFERGFAFIKVKKTAGTSVELFLERLAGADAIVTEIVPSEPGHAPRNADRFFNHMPARLARDRVGAERWDRLFRFCFERNPWDKSISRYLWRTRDLPARPDFDEWALQPGNLPTAREMYTIDGKLAVDFIGRFENLTADLATVLRRIGIDAPIELPRAKSLPRQGDGPPIGERADAAIREAFAWELDFFGYDRPERIPWSAR